MSSVLTKPIRNAFAGVSSSNDYFSTKGHGINAFDAELQSHNLSFDRKFTFDLNGDRGRALIPIVNDYDSVVGQALIAWYRMPSGRYEIVGYIA